MLWLDPINPAIRSAVMSGAYGRAPHSDHGHMPPESPTIDTITDALAQASEVLTRLTGGVIHPAGTADEEFMPTPSATRLSPTFTPVRRLEAVRRYVDGVLVTDGSSWGMFGDSLVRQQMTPLPYHAGAYIEDGLGIYPYMSLCNGTPASEIVQVTYNFGSTVTASARAAVLALAHDVYLDSVACDACGLPARTTTVTREGLTYSVGNTVDALGDVLLVTGLPQVDLWVKTVNPHGSVVRPGVYTPSSPPPVVRRVRSARPAFVWPPTSGVTAQATVTSSGSVT